MGKIVDLKKGYPETKKGILVDTNIWLYLFGPKNGDNDHGYGEFLQYSLDHGINLYLTPFIISEFINRTVRLEFAEFLADSDTDSSDISYKRDFRPTDRYNEIYKKSLDVVKDEILTDSNLLIPTNSITVSSLDNPHMLDFNDETIIRTAIDNNLNIATHDRDYYTFSNKDLTIYTR